VTVYVRVRGGQPEVVGITHARGLEQPAGPSEERALKELEVRLQELGISSQGGRA
jgi:hypothetical protein